MSAKEKAQSPMWCSHISPALRGWVRKIQASLGYNGEEAKERREKERKMSSIFTHQENQNRNPKTTPPWRMSLTNETDNKWVQSHLVKCWQGNRHCRSGWQGHVWHSGPFWKTPWQPFKAWAEWGHPTNVLIPRGRKMCHTKLVTVDKKKEKQLKDAMLHTQWDIPL